MSFPFKAWSQSNVKRRVLYDRYSMTRTAEADFKEEQAQKNANTMREENERMVRENKNPKQQIETCRQWMFSLEM